jgi:hypothetical protein
VNAEEGRYIERYARAARWLQEQRAVEQAGVAGGNEHFRGHAERVIKDCLLNDLLCHAPGGARQDAYLDGFGGRVA